MMTREELFKYIDGFAGDDQAGWPGIEKALSDADHAMVSLGEANRTADEVKRIMLAERERCADIVRSLIDHPSKRQEYRAIATAIESVT